MPRQSAKKLPDTITRFHFCPFRLQTLAENVSVASNVRHKIVVMGASKTGKTSLITQFLYSAFTTKYKRTVEEMHRGDFSVNGVNLTLEILDTSGDNEVHEKHVLFVFKRLFTSERGVVKRRRWNKIYCQWEYQTRGKKR
jgi:septin family protein